VAARIKLVAHYLNQMHHRVSQYIEKYVKIDGGYRRQICVSRCFGSSFVHLCFIQQDMLRQRNIIILKIFKYFYGKICAAQA